MERVEARWDLMSMKDLGYINNYKDVYHYIVIFHSHQHLSLKICVLGWFLIFFFFLMYLLILVF